MSNPLRVLLIEDSEDDALLISRELRRANFSPDLYQVASEGSLRAALKDPWDVIVADYNLPGFTGVEALKLMREARVDAPFIMISGVQGEQFVVEAMRAGARDFVTKENLFRLPAAISRALQDAEESRKRRLAEQERDRLLQEVAQRAAELDAAVNSIPDGIAIYDCQGNIRRMNSEAQRLLGLSPEMGTLPMERRIVQTNVMGPDGRPVSMTSLPIMRALAGETVRGEKLRFHPEGKEEIWVSASAAPIRVGETMMGAVLTLIDITELQELRRNQELYTHTISHDLRNPLTVVSGNAQLLQILMEKDENLTEIEPYVQMILAASEKMESLIEDLVDVARLEGGTLKLELREISLKPFLRELLEQFNAVSDPRVVEMDMPVEPPPIVVDPQRLERILLNLLTNAAKYSPVDAPITIRLQQAQEDIRIAVEDRGKGIHPEDKPHIFERFYRPRGGPNPGSVGLGLYITRMLTEAHGGRIWVESEQGSGSIFTIALPLTPEQEQA